MSGLTMNIREWEEVLPQKGNPLYHRFIEDEASKHTVNVLNEKGILSILELKDGLKITSNSYVGKIKIGDLQINIHPKIEGMPLYRLLKYAYGLRDLNIFDEAIHDIDSFPFHDLLIYQLYAEVEDLVYRGLNKKYKKTEEDLEAPRGRIDIKKLATRSTASSATLPCSYFERSEDNEFNRVLLAGLYLALGLTEDLSLKIRLHRLCKSMEESVSRIELNRGILLKTLKSIDRLSKRYRSALELINILFESQGIRLEDGSMYIKLNGFFFDMNMFFQSLLSKLMKENLEGYTVRDEYTLHELFAYTPGFNPQRRYAPKPRPDFAVMKGSKVICLLDAKYRDLWETKLPREMLYQLSIYAVSGIGNSTAKILYPSMSSQAKLQKIDIKNPATGNKYAEVMLQPVWLTQVAQLINLPNKEKARAQEYMNQIVFGG
jgi:5-methylcytosine-specific restriction enzyme subunit McrC